jgi:hypothetical protein
MADLSTLGTSLNAALVAAGFKTLPNGTWAAGDQPVWNGTNYDPRQRVALELASTFTVATTTLADITGLTLALNRAGTFSFAFVIYVAQATAASVNGLAINYTGTVTRINAACNFPATTTTTSLLRQTVNNTVMAASSMAAGVTIPVFLSGTIAVSTTGTLSVRAQRATAATTVLLGSGGTVMQQ